jgi:hypothetical protein
MDVEAFGSKDKTSRDIRGYSPPAFPNHPLRGRRPREALKFYANLS